MHYYKVFTKLNSGRGGLVPGNLQLPINKWEIAMFSDIYGVSYHLQNLRLPIGNCKFPKFKPLNFSTSKLYSPHGNKLHETLELSRTGGDRS